MSFTSLRNRQASMSKTVIHSKSLRLQHWVNVLATSTLQRLSGRLLGELRIQLVQRPLIVALASRPGLRQAERMTRG
jgi:hypothetical protein